MNELPKFVTGRLTGPGEQALVHPDVDLLTAFLEQKVTRSEREQVFAHLSQCSSCREVLNLAAPETVTAASAPGTVKGEVTSLRWPGMRWASVAAASVVVLAIGIALRPTLTDKGPSQPATEVVVKNVSPAAPLADQMSTAEASRTARAAESETGSAPSPTKKSEIARNEIASPKSTITAARGNGKIAPAGKPAFEKDTHAPDLNLKKQRSTVNQTVGVTAQSATIPATSAPVPGANSNGVVGGIVAGQAAGTARADRDQTTTYGQTLDPNGNVQQRKFVIQPQQQQTPTQAFLVQQPAGASKGANVPPPPPPPSASTSSATDVAANAKPAVEDKEAVAGPLTLETRGGRNTRAKAVIPGFRPGGFGATSLNPSSLKVSSEQTFSWKISPEGKLLRKTSHEDSWRSVELPSTATLHSLASNKLDVWVGGAPLSGESAGALFHTTDGGEHWQRVNGPWTGDILALQASSANHSVQVRTAGGEWQTQDAGQNWIRTR